MSGVAGYLDLKAEKLEALKAHLAQSDQPPAALQATARVASASGVRPVQVRNFTIVTDSGPALAGYDLGPTAPELLLSSLASCVAHTFLIVAANKGYRYDSLEVTVSASIDFRGVLEVGEGIPSAPQQLRYEARIGSQLSGEQLGEIQRDVERLCPVLQAITQPLAVEGTIVQV
jgi:uncharacterized OsmC-like protein